MAFFQRIKCIFQTQANRCSKNKIILNFQTKNCTTLAGRLMQDQMMKRDSDKWHSNSQCRRGGISSSYFVVKPSITSYLIRCLSEKYLIR